MKQTQAWNGLRVAIIAAGLTATLAPLWAAPPEVAAPAVAPVPATQTPFASEIAAFEQADKKAAPPMGGVLFVGSSSIRYWTSLAQDFPELPVLNRGFGGSTIEQNTLYADRIVIPYKPRLIVFYAGGNDINGGKTPEQVLVDFGVFAHEVQTALPATSIAFVSINPSLARWKQEGSILQANGLIEKYIRDTNSPTRKLAFIDSHAGLLGADGQPQAALLRADKLHLNADGYKVWKALVKPQILALATDAGVERLHAPDAAPAP